MKTIQMPYSKLAQALGVKDVYLKREDQHKYGSHKGRSIPPMVKKYFKDEGITNFVISSSGNAALAAIHAIQVHNSNNPSKLKLKVLVGQNIDSFKLKRLLKTINDVNVSIEQVERPKQVAFQMDKDGLAKNLRQSTDDNALIGYQELAQELDSIPNLSAIFIPTSSGTTAQALGEAFHLENYLKLKQKPQIHIIQTTACHPIAGVIASKAKQSPADTKKSIAGAIVDKIAHRKNKVAEIIKKSEGSGWVATNEEIKEAQKLVKQTTGLEISPNSALSIAGLKKAKDSGFDWKDGVVVCLVTGM
ncbi:PLP-dependent lyase/thiolase [Patescibacteria group bacterium]|nr:PLP-dependent lyase/thiolase [Patescibacteria group bacterium]